MDGQWFNVGCGGIREMNQSKKVKKNAPGSEDCDGKENVRCARACR